MKLLNKSWNQPNKERTKKNNVNYGELNGLKMMLKWPKKSPLLNKSKKLLPQN